MEPFTALGGIGKPYIFWYETISNAYLVGKSQRLVSVCELYHLWAGVFLVSVFACFWEHMVRTVDPGCFEGKGHGAWETGWIGHHIHHMHHCIYWKQIGQNVNVCSEVGARASAPIIFCTFHAYLKCFIIKFKNKISSFCPTKFLKRFPHTYT